MKYNNQGISLLFGGLFRGGRNIFHFFTTGSYYTTTTIAIKTKDCTTTHVARNNANLYPCKHHLLHAEGESSSSSKLGSLFLSPPSDKEIHNV